MKISLISKSSWIDISNLLSQKGFLHKTWIDFRIKKARKFYQLKFNLYHIPYRRDKSTGGFPELCQDFTTFRPLHVEPSWGVRVEPPGTAASFRWRRRQTREIHKLDSRGPGHTAMALLPTLKHRHLWDSLPGHGKVSRPYLQKSIAIGMVRA